MWQEPSRWVLLFERFGDDHEHYINLFFASSQDAYEFAKTIPQLKRCIAVTEDEFFVYKQELTEGINGEASYWRSRTPRPVQRNIVELVEPVEDECQQGGYRQFVSAVSDEREHIPEKPFRNYHPGFTHPNFATLPFNRKK
jgi:hypothetical protein